MAQPLNLALYQSLQRVFGRVRISNEGQAMMSQYGVNRMNGRNELIIINPGEQYNVNCDRCQDSGFRLTINHTFGRYDERGNRHLFMAHCYNEHCYTHNEEARYDLLERLEDFRAGTLSRVQIEEGREVTESPDSELPGTHLRLDTLPPEHPANRYLAGRFFDPERLGRFYDVGYCTESFHTLARGRIIAPIYFLGKLKGWQARYVGDIDWKAQDIPKWWSDPSMKKNMVLYNFDKACRYRTGVLVEGPSSAWGFGPMAMATLGSSMSLTQGKYLFSRFADHAMILLWDPDVRKDPKKFNYVNEKVIPMLEKQFRNGFAPVWLPDGMDPGSMDGHAMREFVTREARGMGVRVDWRLR